MAKSLVKKNFTPAEYPCQEQFMNINIILYHSCDHIKRFDLLILLQSISLISISCCIVCRFRIKK